MPESLFKLFEQGSDFELCNGIFIRIVDFYGGLPESTQMPEFERAVLLVWHTMGILENGGFGYLFEGDLPGDPDYSLTIDAYERIGCEGAVKAFRDAMRLFDGGTPPLNVGERLFQFRRGDGTRRGEINAKFDEVNDQIKECLAQYIRDHRKEFARLDGSKPSKPPPETEEPRRLDPVAVGIAELPHWARVAFAVYCARQVFPLFDDSWPDALPKRRAGVVKSISLADESAAAGKPTDGLEDAADQATMAAGAASMITMHGVRLDDEPGPPDGNSAAVVGSVIKSAEFAARAAAAPTKKSVQYVMESYASARGLADADQLENLAATFRRLWRVARKGGWTHRTPVPQSALEEGFVPDEPSRPWWKFW